MTAAMGLGESPFHGSIWFHSLPTFVSFMISILKCCTLHFERAVQMLLSLVKMTHFSSFCCVSPECIPVTQPESQRSWNYSTGKNNEHLIGSSFIALLIFILKRVVASVSTDSSQAGTVNSTDRERLQSRSQVIGDSVCVSVFCLHIKLLTRKTAFSECLVYCTNRRIVCSIRCSPGPVIPPFLPALSLPPIAPSSLGPLAPPQLLPSELLTCPSQQLAPKCCEPFISLQQAAFCLIWPQVGLYSLSPN